MITIEETVVEQRLLRRKASKKKWKENNRDKINVSRRRRRKEKRVQMLVGRKCLLCEILLSNHCFRSRKYCDICLERWPYKTKLHGKRYSRILKKRCLKTK